MCADILSTSTTALVICLHPPALFGKNLAKGMSSDSESEEQDDSPSTATTLPVQVLLNQGMETRDPFLTFPSNCRDVEDTTFLVLSSSERNKKSFPVSMLINKNL